MSQSYSCISHLLSIDAKVGTGAGILGGVGIFYLSYLPDQWIQIDSRMSAWHMQLIFLASVPFGIRLLPNVCAS